MSKSPKRRVIVAKCGLDGHDRGAKVISLALRDAGFEVIYTGLRQTPEKVVRDAVDEDVLAICLSILSGTHLMVVERIRLAQERLGASDIHLVLGGVIPDSDKAELHALGVSAIFGPGSSLREITEYIANLLEPAK